MIAQAPVAPVSTSKAPSLPYGLSRLANELRAELPVWQARSPAERSRLIRLMRYDFLRRADEFVQAVVTDTGQPAFDAAAEIMHLAQLFAFCERTSKKLMRPRSVWWKLLVHKRARIEHRPVGLVGLISPANYPLILSIGPAIQALSMGNAVLIKPSERVPLVNDVLAAWLDGWRVKGIPAGLWVGGPADGERLIEERPDKLVYIGGPGGAKVVSEACHARGIDLVLELGGNDAMLVARDADIDRAAQSACWGAFFHAGQSCIAVQRCYVDAEVAPAFESKVADIVRTLVAKRHKLAREADQASFGPVYNADHAVRIKKLIDDAVARGARILAQGTVADATDPCLVPATVLTKVRSDMRVSTEEVFGPVLAIERVSDLDEGVAKSNASPLGLSASIWTKDRREARRAAAALDVGGVAINDCLTHFAIVQLPFGGRKGSGTGRLQGREGLLTFVHATAVVESILPLREPQWFPPKLSAANLIKATRLLFGKWW